MASTLRKKRNIEKKSHENEKDILIRELNKDHFKNFTADDYRITPEEPPERIAGIYPKNKVTLAYGVPGSGKTTGTISRLNKNNITPILINIDNGGLSLDDYDFDEFGYSFIKPLFNGSADDYVKDKVIVIDTYTKLVQHSIFKDKSSEEIVELFEELCREADTTLIIIGHAQQYTSSKDIFSDNNALMRSAYEVILYEMNYTKKDGYTYKASIRKGRNGIGCQEINNEEFKKDKLL